MNGAALFGVIFLAVSGLRLVTFVRDAPSADTWVKTAAHVKKVGLKTVYRSHGTSEELSCTYEYLFQGRVFRGYEIGLFGLGVRSRDEWYGLLFRHKDIGEAIPCFVNPSDPSQAVLTCQWSASDVWFDMMIASAGVVMLTAWVLVNKPFRFEVPDHGD